MSNTVDDLNHVADWTAETSESITARLNGANASQSQTRVTLGVMVVVSLMMLITSYNAYFSYDYHWLVSEKDLPIDETKAAGVLRVQALKDFAEARIVQVSFLGIRVSVDDAPVLGTAVLLVLSFWLLLVSRRENYTIGFLLRDTDSSRPQRSAIPTEVQTSVTSYTDEQRWRIFHSILANSVLLTLNGSLARFQTLKQRGFFVRSERARPTELLNRLAFTVVRSFFFMFPVVTALAVFAVDRYSYFIPDPFEQQAAIPDFHAAFFWQSLWFFVICWVPLTLSCWRSRQYLVATEKILHQYAAALRKDLLSAERGEL